MSTNTDEITEFFGPPISVYTRADAIDDGVLVDVTEAAAEAGFNCPVALTRAVWEDCVAWGEADNRAQGAAQDEAGRLWDVLFMAATAVRAVRDASECRFSVLRVPRKSAGYVNTRTYLKAVIGPGDAGEPVLTILLRNED